MKKISYYLICTSVLIGCNSTTKKQPPITVIENNSPIENQIIPQINTTAEDTTTIQTNHTSTTTKEVISSKESVPIKEVVTKPAAVKVVEKVKEVIPKKVLEKSVPKKNIESETVLTTSTDEVVTAIEPKKEIAKVPLKPSHTTWNELTKNHVSKDGKVNYTAFKKNLATLETYLKLLEETPPTKEWSRAEKLAYWFNLYNASTVHLVATNYPVKSIKNINGGKPWDKKFIASGSAIYSLNDIENTVVRPNYNEPRLHVAFNCAAVSCPNLLNEAFEASKLNIQLDKLAKQWISDSNKNELTDSEKINISQIFNWYAVDFKNGVIPFINKYTNNPINENASIDYLEYNWDLND